MITSDYFESMKGSERLSRYEVFLPLLYSAMHGNDNIGAFVSMEQWLEEINIPSIIVALLLCHSLFFF